MSIRIPAVFAVLFVGCILAAEEPKKEIRPKTILVIRHAEKPETGIDLNEAGKKRAEALPGLFKKSDTRPDPFPLPDFIFAAAASEKSDRSFQTVTPLAKKLNLEIRHEIKNADFALVATELRTKPKYDGKTVLIAWHHGKMPDLVHALGVNPQPNKMDDGVFDRVWVVTFDEKGKAKFVDQPQDLMPGDAKK